MGQLFLLNDCATQEELLKHVIRLQKAQKKKRVLAKKKPTMNVEVPPASVENTMSIDANVAEFELYTMKAMTSKASTQTYTVTNCSSFKSKCEFQYTNVLSHKLETSEIEHSDIIVMNTNNNAKVNPADRKRKRDSAREAESPKASQKKLKRDCDLQTEKLNQTDTNSSKLNTNKFDIIHNKTSISSCVIMRNISSNRTISSPEVSLSKKHTIKIEKEKATISEETANVDYSCNRMSDFDIKQHGSRSLAKMEDKPKSSDKNETSFNLKIFSNENDAIEIMSDSETDVIEVTSDNENDVIEVMSDSESEKDHQLSNRSAEFKNIPNHRYVAMDCEMVGVGHKGSTSVLARCSIVDYDGNVIYDEYVRPLQTITDYRTRWSGIRAVHMKTAVPITTALKDIKECLENKVVIGHAVYNDFKVLNIVPDYVFVRDTSQCQQLSNMANLPTRGNSLKKLSEALLGRIIQNSKHGHCSVEDARATLDLFKLVRNSWEPELYLKWSKKNNDLHKKIASFVDRVSEPEDFLHDKFWPSHILD